MILEIDTQAKTVKLKTQGTLAEITKELKKLLGEDYKDYQLVPHSFEYTYYPYNNGFTFVTDNCCSPTDARQVIGSTSLLTTGHA